MILIPSQKHSFSVKLLLDIVSHLMIKFTLLSVYIYVYWNAGFVYIQKHKKSNNCSFIKFSIEYEYKYIVEISLHYLCRDLKTFKMKCS